ncbi:MAG: hypothetical protein M3Y50_12350 [Acidobacteriota bacterium]|nr:hypothetical protein [Acidobacteriota bacterium]
MFLRPLAVSFTPAARGHPPFSGGAPQPSSTPRGETRFMNRPLAWNLSAN